MQASRLRRVARGLLTPGVVGVQRVEDLIAWQLANACRDALALAKRCRIATLRLQQSREPFMKRHQKTKEALRRTKP